MSCESRRACFGWRRRSGSASRAARPIHARAPAAARDLRRHAAGAPAGASRRPLRDSPAARKFHRVRKPAARRDVSPRTAPSYARRPPVSPARTARFLGVSTGSFAHDSIRLAVARSPSTPTEMCAAPVGAPPEVNGPLRAPESPARHFDERNVTVTPDLHRAEQRENSTKRRRLQRAQHVGHPRAHRHARARRGGARTSPTRDTTCLNTTSISCSVRKPAARAAAGRSGSDPADVVRRVRHGQRPMSKRSHLARLKRSSSCRRRTSSARGLSSPGRPGCRSRGSSMRDLISASVAAITRYSPASSSCRSRVASMYCRYCQ